VTLTGQTKADNEKETMMSEVVQGACLCGKLAFEVSEPEALVVCHCTRCQRWAGTSLPVVVVAPERFMVTAGQDLMRCYHEDGFGDRYFCSHCGSSVYGDGGEKYYVGAGLLQSVGLQPALHLQVASKAPWRVIGDDAPQFAEWAS
jgi:hypothetical protein